jgi:riboflavin transporter FmnP
MKSLLYQDLWLGRNHIFGGFKMQRSHLNRLVKISVLSAVALLLMTFVEVPLPIFPSFLKLDISDLPALFGAFSMGPVAGIIIEIVKNALHLMLKPDVPIGVGELANFIVGGAFVFITGLVYIRKKNKSHALVGLILGSIAMTIVAAIGNYFIFMPLYISVFSLEGILKAAQIVNPAISDLGTLVVYSIVPFNLLKAFVVSLIAFLSYKSLSPILHK